MKSPTRLALTLLGLAALPSAHALTPAQAPLFVSSSIPPQVMLDISKDQQLYKKAYNDYSDLDGDGQLETTYKHSIDYYGYFDSYKCYTYDTADGRFEPVSVTDNKYCNGTTWSGNFLNWVTMSRMDAVRKLLYGGLRSTDTSATTVLERAYIPADAHAWAKYYNGNDINQLTPFNPPVTPATVTSNTNLAMPAATPAAVEITVSDTTKFSYGDQVVIRAATDPQNTYMIGAVSCVNGTGIGMYNSLVGSSDSCAAGKIKVVVEQIRGAGTYNSWNVENWTQTGITLCNITMGASTDKSQNNTNPPLMRVAQGNFSLWAANERRQCMWREETIAGATDIAEVTSSIGGRRTNGNRAALTGLYASSIGPNKTTTSAGRIKNGLGEYDYTVRVQACVAGLLGKERCKQYPSGNYKPIGLLQYYGDTGQLYFGLMTGSHRKNISGGVLRKAMGPLTDEVNVNTDGTFVQPATPPGSPRTTTSAATPPGIINTLNYMRIYGYRYDNGTYQDASGDNCTWQLTNITENQCTSWGNPMSEIYYESLRYFAGKSATASYTYTNSGSKDNLLGLPLASWGTGPLNNSNYCSALNVVLFNASVSGNDNDLAATDLADINKAGSTAAVLTDVVGAGEGIHGASWFVGRNGTNNNELCDAKTVNSLSSVAGICPEGPTLLGSYLMSGLAYQAKTNRIRTDLTVPADDKRSLKVSTYGVQLATNVPQIRIALQGETQPRVIIQPAYRLNIGGTYGGGQLVDMRIIYQTATDTTASGLIYLNWEDSEQGGDYDQDVWGVLSYSLDKNANTITVTTRVLAESTGQPQGFGYIISGTTQDGPHFHSGIENFDFNDPTNISVTPAGQVNATGGCDKCNVSDAATTATYTLGATAAGQLKDPLWYAAKWGGFTETGAGNNQPDQVAEWDAKKTDGSAGADGIPDNYFLVSNPLGLEQALDRTFTSILEKAAASAVATNSTSIRTDSRVYQGRFNANDWSGQLLSYTLSAAGVLSDVEEWDAGLKLNDQRAAASDNRTILTLSLDSKDGMAFTWANISALADTTQKDALNQAGGIPDGRGADRVGWLRGHSQHEGKASNTLRERSRTKLGDIVNSNPIYVGPPAAGYSDVDYPGYQAFATAYKNRKPILYVGANDGMLHGFNVKPGDVHVGKEAIAYVPSSVYGSLSELTRQGYTHRYTVDGSPMVADAYFDVNPAPEATDNEWRTVLIGTLGAGGRGIYALDVTNPDDATKGAPTFSEANAASLVLWEFTSANDADLGYTFNYPAKHYSNGQSKQIVRMNNDRWALVIGNGYESSNRKAALLILFLDGGTDGSWTLGTDYIKIPVGDDDYSGSGGVNGNGLSTPMPKDKNGDGKVDVIYAGDLNGNLWKFDVSSTDPGNWAADLGGVPLFVAKDGTGKRQPILAPPEITPHKLGGYMVLLGTGKYLESGDVTSTDTQSFYGVWDRNGIKYGATTISGENNIDRTWLVAQTLTTHNSGSTVNGKTIQISARTSSSNAITWCEKVDPDDCMSEGAPNAYRGWRVDLPTSKERVTGVPQLLNGVIYFSTFIPSTAACDHGGDGWLLGLDYLTGGQPAFPTFDTDADYTVENNEDLTGAGIKTGAALGGATFVKLKPDSGEGIAILNPLAGGAAGGGGGGGGCGGNGSLTTCAHNGGPGMAGRISWHELVE